MSDEEKKVEETTTDAKPEEATPEATEAKDAAPAEETPAEAPAEAPAEDSTPAPSEEKEAESAEIPEATKGEAAVELPHADIVPGMLVRVHERIVEPNAKGEVKTRTQVFEGLVLGTKGSDVGRSMTVRKNSKGWMVEKIFPLSSPNVEKVEVVKQYRTRRAKLSYLRGRFKRKLREVKETK